MKQWMFILLILFLGCGATHKSRTDVSIPDVLNYVKNSNYTFVRNGHEYSSQDAADWLEWKMHHKQYRKHPIVTVDDFIDRVADRSRKTGELYYIVVDGKMVRLQGWLDENFRRNNVEEK